MDGDAVKQEDEAVASLPLRCLVGTQTGLVKLIDLADASASITHGKPVKDGKVSSLGPGRELREVVVAMRDGDVLLLGSNGAMALMRVSGFGGPVAGAALVECDTAGTLALSCCTEAGALFVIDLAVLATGMGCINVNVAATPAPAAVMARVQAGKPVEAFVVAPSCRRLVALGGKDNRLALWDMVERKRVFQARNPPDDWLGMSVPTWISAIAFAPGKAAVLGDGMADATLATVSRHHDLQLYVTTQGGNRAIKKMELGEDPLTCVCWTADAARIIVGNAVGVVWVVDVAQWVVEGRLAPSCLGSVRDVSACRRRLTSGGDIEDLLVAVGLDRFVYCYRLHRRTLYKKLYVKQRLCRVLMVDEDDVDVDHADGGAGAGADGEVVAVKQEDSDDDGDWAAMPVVGNKRAVNDAEGDVIETGAPPSAAASVKKLKAKMRKVAAVARK